jgi:hypothetical protein
VTGYLIRQTAFALLVLLVLVRQVETMNDLEHRILNYGGSHRIVELDGSLELVVVAADALDNMRLP